MTNEQKSVRDWMSSFGQETPTKPTIPSLEIRKLRAKLILEEAIETIEKGLGIDVFIGQSRRDCRLTVISTLDFVENIHKPNLLEIADGCEDLKVVIEGTLVACGLCQPMIKSVTEGDHYGTYTTKVKDMSDPLFDEVMKSNNSKMWTNQEVWSAYAEYKGPKGLKETGRIQYWNNLTAVRMAEDKWLVKDKDGKVVKPNSYSPANLQPIIDAL